MKKVLLVIGVILIIGLFFVLTGSNGDSPGNTESGQDTTRDTTAETSNYTKAEAEGLLGISLPDDSTINIILDNSMAVGVIGNTDTSLDDLQTFFESEMQSGSYTISRPWGISPSDSETLHTATYTGSGEIWAVFLRDENGSRQFDLQRQF
jgi:hypothetical protein